MISPIGSGDRERALALLAGHVAPDRTFFEVAAQALALGSGCRWAGVGLSAVGGESIELLAFWDGDQLGAPFRFPLLDTPCAEVYQAAHSVSHCFFGTAVADRFPGFPMLREMGARSYRGEGFFGVEGNPIGHVFVLGESDEDDRAPIRSFFRLVAQRVGAEYNRLRAEEKLARSEARHAALFRQSNDGVLLLDTAGRIIDVNRATCRRLMRSRKELIGRDAITLIGDASAPQARTALGKLVDGGGDDRRGEMMVRRKDGSTYPIEVTTSLVATPGEQLVQVIVRDLTERKQAEEALFRSRKLESLGKLAGGIAHDFNNLLARVLGGTELAIHEPEITPSVAGHLVKIREAALRASDLCIQMRAYAGQRQQTLEPLAFHQLVEQVVTATGKEQVTVEVAPSLPSMEGDERQLGQMISSLVTNALEAIEDSSPDEVAVPAAVPTVGPGVAVSLDLIGGDDPLFERILDGHIEAGARADHYLRLAVRDHGVGMDANTLANVFDPFFTTKFMGRGLSMAAVLGTVKTHAGGIALESQPGKGTTVDVVLPALPRNEVALAAVAQPVQLGTATGTVMVVDDEPMVRDIARKLLEGIGYRVLSMGDGAEAVRTFEEAPDTIDAVLLDLTMPGLSGEEVGRAMRRVRPGLPIVVASGYSELDVSEMLGDVRFDFYLRKPYELRRLVEVMAKVIAPD